MSTTEPTLSGRRDATLPMDIRLRDVTSGDIAVFYEHQRDPASSEVAGLYPRDEEAFTAHWERLLQDPSGRKKTIEIDGEVAGQVLSFDSGGQREVGYWLGREYWGKGIATIALSAFLREELTRPLFAHAAKHNVGSIRVLEKCGFQRVREQMGDANGRGPYGAEVVYSLEQ
jgi:RimJ/RimL family protein N-acetyltransferase